MSEEANGRPGPGCIGCAAIAVAIALVAMLIPAIQSPANGRRSPCASNLKQIGIALHNYHEKFKSFPPAYLTDASGQPTHSWRALLLPFIEGVEPREIARRYRFDEPWNGPNNLALTKQAPAIYRCPSSMGPAGETSYLAVVGPQTGWPAPQALKVRHFTDGLSNTIAVVDVGNSGINWLEPRDLTFEEASRGMNQRYSPVSISTPHTAGTNFLFFDSSVRFIQDSIDPALLAKFFTAASGDHAELPED